MGGSNSGRLNSVFKNPIALLSAALFILNQFIERQGWFLPFIHSYFDDFLCMPVFLTLALIIYTFFLHGKGVYRLSISQIIFTVIYLSFIFEFILPKYSTKYVSDYWDLLPYSLGAIIFYFFINPKKQKAALL